MPSATTAERSDSIAPSIAMANAAGKSSRISPKLRDSGCPSGPGKCHGSEAVGNALGMPWPPSYTNRVPMVETSAPLTDTTTAANASATSGAGTLAVMRGQANNTKRVKQPTARLAIEAVGNAWTSTPTRSAKGSGMGPVVRPRKSFSCSVAITTAMPAVKPVVTG